MKIVKSVFLVFFFCLNVSAFAHSHVSAGPGGEFVLSPLTADALQEVAGGGCGYYLDEDTYMFEGRISIGGQVVDLAWKSEGEYEGDWQGIWVTLKVISTGETEVVGEGPEGYSTSLVELRLSSGDTVSSIKTRQICGD